MSKKRTCKIAVLILILLIIISSIYLFLPYKVIIPLRVSQLLFGDNVDSYNIKQQASYMVGPFGNTAYFDENGNTVITINRVEFFKFKNKCKKELRHIKNLNIKIINDKVSVFCTKAEVPRKMIDADYYIRYYILDKICDGISPDKINLFVGFYDVDSGGTFIEVNWPNEEYNINREDFFS